MKKVHAQSWLQVLCHCPHCNSYEDVFKSVMEILDENLSSKDCEVEVTCSECGKEFIIDEVIY